jgi:hypothetical protein
MCSGGRGTRVVGPLGSSRPTTSGDQRFVRENVSPAESSVGATVGAARKREREEMRAFVRGDAPEMQAGDLNEGLRATANMFRRSQPREISIEVDCTSIPAIRFQSGQMNQVFFNWIQNAVDAIEGAASREPSPCGRRPNANGCG